MNDLLIRIKKKSDGSAALSCLRPDGSVTWQRQNGQQGRFFPLHDLTHYAVEAVLGHARGFYGLVAEGWYLADFGNPWPRGPLPPEALVRSEEHTSELQSQSNLVCRLLLEKYDILLQA